MKRTFKGGIHPYEGKHLSENAEITEYLPKGDCVFPLSQHIGAPAKPVVKKGDEVLAGQLIAEAGGFVSANIYSSISGKVKAIEPRLQASGSKVNSIIIENDGKFASVEYQGNNKPLSEFTKEEILAAVKTAGIVGMGGAGFPTHVKLSPKEPEKIDRIIVNGSECEPYLTSDFRRLVEQGDAVIEGLRLILRIFPGAKGIIAIEDNKQEAIKMFSEKLEGDAEISVHPMKTKYPEGAERQLIYANTGRLINSKMLPADVGCIVHNVDTVHAIYEAVRLGKPLIDRVVTVTGNAIARPGNFLARVGTSYRELTEAAGGVTEDLAKLVSGGPMMGKAIYTLDLPVTKGSSAILCLDKDEVAESEPSACIRCGRCVDVCPGRVVPMQLANLAEQGDTEAFLKQNGMECCECGCCSYVCPARRHLTQIIAGTRKLILAERKR